MNPYIQFSRPYQKGWKILSMTLIDQPKGFKEWARMIWGFDIWVQRVPFLKAIVAANVLVWVVFR